MVKVAAIQAAPVAYDLSASLNKVESLVSEAAAQGARLAVLPEAFLSAYPRHSGGYSIGSRTEEQREWFGRYVRVRTEHPCESGGETCISEYSASGGDHRVLERRCDGPSPGAKGATWCDLLQAY